MAHIFFAASIQRHIATPEREIDARTLGEALEAVFAQWLAPLRACEWVVYAKRPFAGPEAVLAYLSRYTHRVAISNQRLVALDERGVTFRWKRLSREGAHPLQDHDPGRG